MEGLWRDMHIDTRAILAPRKSEFGAVVPPVHLSSTFELDIDSVSGDYAYQRGSNPSRADLESVIASLEEAKHGFAFATGMAAVSSVFSLLSPGDEVLFSSNVYGGTFRYVEKIFPRAGLTGTFFDDLGSITSEDLSENTRMIFVETPGNPTLRVVDIERLAKLAHAHGALLVIDNTFMTAVLQRPLDFGADLVVQSATKFLGGHSDLLAGAVTTNDDELAENIRLSQKVFGGVLEPLTSFRLLQAIKTLPLRIARQQENAEKLVAFLSDHPAVQTVLSAGSFSEAEREVHERQAQGIGAVFSFELAQGYDLKKFLHALEIPWFAVSLGGVESLLSIPATMSHDGMTQAARDRAGITDGLVRFSAGIENIDDLLADFAKALDAAQK